MLNTSFSSSSSSFPTFKKTKTYKNGCRVITLSNAHKLPITILHYNKAGVLTKKEEFTYHYNGVHKTNTIYYHSSTGTLRLIAISYFSEDGKRTLQEVRDPNKNLLEHLDISKAIAEIHKKAEDLHKKHL